MERDSRSRWQGKGSLEELMRERIRGTIELIVEQELPRRARRDWMIADAHGANALGVGSPERAVAITNQMAWSVVPKKASVT